MQNVRRNSWGVENNIFEVKRREDTPLLFPSTVPILSPAAVYASFAVMLLMRPVGSAVFGHHTDVYGRKSAMLVAIVGGRDQHCRIWSAGVGTVDYAVVPAIE
jgi:MFS family permease